MARWDHRPRPLKYRPARALVLLGCLVLAGCLRKNGGALFLQIEMTLLNTARSAPMAPWKNAERSYCSYRRGRMGRSRGIWSAG